MSTEAPIFDTNLRVRIPPSPTGPLHLGTARTALYNWLLVKKHGGKFVFRLEDTDRERSKSEFVSDIINGFKWMGITWDEGPLRQSEHKARHQMVVRELLEKGAAYECFCNSEELEEIRISQRALNKVEGYDNRHRTLTEQQKQIFREQGRKPVVRFKLPDNYQIEWFDLIRGKMSVNTSDLGGDPVIAKDNGDVLYNFAVVVDDHDANINCIIRGEDHLHNTAKQIPLYEAMGWDVPWFAHVPLILTANREKLSKRKHGDIASISKYINEGYLPEAISNYLVAMSWHHPSFEGKEVFLLSEVIDLFDLKDLSKSAAVYDPQKLHWFCKEHFKRLTPKELLDRARPFLDKSEVFMVEYSEDQQLEIVSLFKDGLTTLSELPGLVKIFCSAPAYTHLEHEAKTCIEDPATKKILLTFQEILNTIQLPQSLNPSELLNELAEKTGIKKGKKLFWPIRVALTGQTHGADLTKTIELLGVNQIKERVQNLLNFVG
jgi:glutamyl-tRNA synthetase